MFGVSKTKSDLGLRFCAWLGLAVGTALPGTGWAAEQASPDFRPYPIQHVRATDLESTLVSLLPAGTEILIDPRGNRVLIRGPASTHAAAERVIQSLDKTPAAAPAAAEAPRSAPLLKIYPCAPGQAKPMADALQAEFGATAGVRIVPDERTAQILVVAPTELHGPIASRLTAPGQTVPPAAQPGAAPQPPAAQPTARQPSGRPYQLTRVPAERFEAFAAAMLGNRFVPAGSGNPNIGVYRLLTADGSQVVVTVNRAANTVEIAGNGPAVDSFTQFVRAIDAAPVGGDESTRLVALHSTRPDDARRTVDALRASNGGRKVAVAPGPLAAKLFQSRPGETIAVAQAAPAGPAPAAPAPGSQAPVAPTGPAPQAAPGGEADAGQGEAGGMIGPVQVEMLDGLDVLIIRGHRRDVQRVMEIIQQIERLSQETEPAIIVFPLSHVDSVPLATLVNQLYAEVFASRQGAVSITALVKPNAMLLIGRKESVQQVIDLIKRLDVPVPPESQFQVFRLRHAAATTVQTTVQGFFTDRGGLSPQVRVTADSRSNALIVQASPRDMAEVAAMIARLDVDTSEAVNELKIFHLSHASADELLPVLQDAIGGQAAARLGAAGAPAPQAPTPQAGGAATSPRTSMLQLMTVDVQGQRKLNSGILSDVKITADARANTLVVSAPADSMPLIEALIKQMDQPAAVRAEIKVFTVVNGDATALAQTVQDLFGQTATPGQTGALGAAGTAAGENSLVPLRLAVDLRTNSIIAAGTRSELLVVEAVLLRLDETDVRNRKSIVYRLKNAPAADVANAVNSFLRSERDVERLAPGVVTPFEQIEREVVVVPEPVSNSLIVSATPRFFDEIARLVEELDQRPPMVMIQVLIAEVTLTNTDEFGVELGLQDSVLFNRSIGGTGGALVPGFNFNNQPLGGFPYSPNTVGTQGLSSLSLNRSNSELGFGGLVLSASSESVSVLLRALQERRRLEVLSRPQVMTLDNQPAYIQVGQRVPQIRGVSLTAYGQTNNVDYEDVGLILQVIPRISPDGLVVMEIDANRSDVGPEAEGIPVSISSTGQVIRSPRINRTLAQTTVSALSGQTVILGGLISKQKILTHRQVPLLGDVPVLGNLFRYDFTRNQRSELLIIMTPQIVRNEEDMERIKKIEAARMHWCLADVIEMHGDAGLRARCDDWSDAETTVVHPDGAKPEVVPTPAPNGTPRLNSPEAPPALEPVPGTGQPAAPPGSPSALPPAGHNGTSSQGPVLQPAPRGQPAAGGVRRTSATAPLDEFQGTTPTTVRYGEPNPLRGRQ